MLGVVALVDRRPVGRGARAGAARSLAPMGGARARGLRDRRPDDARRPGAVRARADHEHEGSGHATRQQVRPTSASVRRAGSVCAAASTRMPRTRPCRPRPATAETVKAATSADRRGAARRSSPALAATRRHPRAVSDSVSRRCRRRGGRRRRRARRPDRARRAAAVAAKRTTSPSSDAAIGSPCARTCARIVLLAGNAVDEREVAHRDVVTQQLGARSERDRCACSRRCRRRTTARPSRRRPRGADRP